MRPHSFRLIVVGACLLGLTTFSHRIAAQNLDSLRSEIAAVGGRVIVGVKPANAPHGMTRPGVRSLSYAEVQLIANRLAGMGLRVTRNYRLITAVAGVVTDEGISLLLNDPNVEYVAPDQIHTLDVEPVVPGGAPSPTVETIPWGVAKINAPLAWAATPTPNYGAGVKVGILDTGGDFDHEDLLFAGGFDAILGSTLPADWDDNLTTCGGHGTHVAGIVGARLGNGLGYVGVAPSASLYAIQVFSQYLDPFGNLVCGAFASDLIAGVDWAASNGIQVLNMSLGGPCCNPAEHAAYQAAAAAGVNLVAAAGNSNRPTSGFAPATYPEVIAVAATDINDFKAFFSNFGPEVFVAAPGVGITSTLPGNTYGAYDGTSQASPHVAGLVALLLAANPSLSNASIRGLLAAGAIDLGAAGRDVFFGEGRIDALNSVNLQLQQSTSATQLALVQQPGNGTSGQPLSPAPIVELRNSLNLPVMQAGVVVTAQVASGPGQVFVLDASQTRRTGANGEKLPPTQIATTAVVTNASGQAVFSSLAVTTVLPGTHQLVFSAGNLTPVISAPFSVTGTLTTLTSGVPLPGLGGGTGSLTYFVINVPAGQGVLTVSTSGGGGDVDLYVRSGTLPNLQVYDCRPFLNGNNETCVLPSPTAGDYFIMLDGFAAYSGVTLTATVSSGAPATQLAMVVQPSNGTSGVPLSPAPVVELRDAQNQPVPQAGVTITAAVFSGPGQVTSLGTDGSAGVRDPNRPPAQVATTAVTTNSTGQAVFSDLTVTTQVTADHQLVFSSPNLTSVVSTTFTVTGTTVTPLTNGVPVVGLSGASGSQVFYVIGVPPGRTDLTVFTFGGTGDADLYVRLGALPDFVTFDCRPFLFGNNETCSFTNPAAGDYYIMIDAFASYAAMTLKATYTPPVGAATQLALVVPPTGGVSGQPVAPAPVVELRDATGQQVSQAGVSITASKASGPGNLSGTLTVMTDAQGHATFTGLVLTGAGSYTLDFSATNLTTATSPAFPVTDPLVITTSSPLPNGVVGTAYSQTFAATGGTGPYMWNVAAGSLPSGLTLNAGTGGLTGTPTTPGTSNFTIQVNDAGTQSAQKAFALTIIGPLTITTASPLPNGVVGAAYSQTLTAAGGTGPYTWSIASGTLPAGLTLNAGTGALSGTPMTAGTSNFTIQVNDASAQSAQKAFALTIIGALTITTASPLPNGVVGAAYNQMLAATGGTGPYTWSVASGTLPAGLTLNAGSGALSGTPTAAGTSNFTIQVNDAGTQSAQKAFALTIIGPLTIITASPLPTGVVGAAYNQTIAATGGTGPYTWSVASGTLPVGLTLNGGTGALSGTPTAAGTSNFTIQVNDAGAQSAQKAFVLTVVDVLTITTSSPLPNGVVGSGYSQTFAVTGGTGPYTWSVASGAVPAGLALNSGTGALTGTPTVAGTSNFTIQVNDASAQSAQKAFVLTIEGALNIMTASPLPNAVVGAAYNQMLAATGGTGSYMWSVAAGSLPAGLTLNAGSGALTGTPTAAGTSNFTIQVNDAGTQSAQKAFSLTVANVLTITTSSPLPNGVVGAAYNHTLAATGGTGAYTWSVAAGSLPAGLTLNAGTGALTGTPTGAGTFNFTIQVNDAGAQSAQKAFSLTVIAALTITTTSPLPNGVVGAAYNQTFAATGGTGAYTWSVAAGTLPAGLTLNAGTGALSGTPTTAGTPNFTIQVNDAGSQSAQKAFALTVAAVLSITTSSPLPNGTVGTAYNQTFAATGGTGVYTWSVAAGSVPPGLTLNAGTGALTGTPTGTGTSNFTIQVNDAGGQSAQQAFTLTAVDDPVMIVNRMFGQLTGSPTLTPAEIGLYDCNTNVAFDVGDLLCYLDAHPGVSLTPEQLALMAELAAPDTSAQGNGTRRKED